MKKMNFWARLLAPVLPVLITAIVSHAGYFGSRSVNNETLGSIMAAFFGTTYFLSIAFGGMFVYTLVYLRGGSLSERVCAAGLTPFLWMTKEVLRLAHSHPFIECLYWYVSPLHLWLIMLMGLEFGGATLIARKIMKTRGNSISVITPAPVIVMAVSLSLVIGAYAWGKGENLYVIFLEGYRFLFGAGT